MAKCKQLNGYLWPPKEADWEDEEQIKEQK